MIIIAPADCRRIIIPYPSPYFVYFTFIFCTCIFFISYFIDRFLFRGPYIEIVWREQFRRYLSLD